MLTDKPDMQAGYFPQLFLRRFPVPFPCCFQHHGCNFLQSCRIFRFKETVYPQIKLIFYIHLIDTIPNIVSDHRRLHHIPSESIPDRFTKKSGRRSSSFHFFTNILRIKKSSTSFYPYRLFQVLHTHVVSVPVITQVSFRILIGHLPDRKIQTTHKLINMIQTQSSPCITLTGLNDYICIM